MLLTVDGPRSARELAELVKALMDSCAGGGRGDLDTVLTEVTRRHHIGVSHTQRGQVFRALAAILPAEAEQRAATSAEMVSTWVGARLPQDPDILYILLMAAWTDLCAQAEAEATREHEEREHEERDPVAEAIRQLTLSGRYYVVAHSGRGKPVLSQTVAGLGLAAGVLAELVLAGRIDLETRTHRLLRTPAGTEAPSPGSELSTEVETGRGDAAGAGAGPGPGAETESAAGRPLSRAAERALEQTPAQPAPLRDHLVDLAARAEDWVREELAESDLIGPEKHRMLREHVYYAPRERGLAKAIRTLVGEALHADPIPPLDALLAELAIATGLDAKQSGGWDRLSSMTRGDALAGSACGDAAEQLKLLIDLTAAEVDTVVTSPGI